MQIQLPAAFSKAHATALGWYFRDPSVLSRQEWALVLKAIDLLREASVTVGATTSPFAEVYETVVESTYADGFIERLLAADDVAVESARLRNRWAKHILDDLRERGFFDPFVPASQLLSGYCLYWWYAFTKGYAFEIEIIRDLEASGLIFTAHDLRTQTGRRSPYDLVIQGYRGDIKSSTYFLVTARTVQLSADLYITLVFDHIVQRYVRVVLLQPSVWATIDGETKAAKLETVTQVFPLAAEIVIPDQRWIVITYETWKHRMRQKQMDKELEQ